MAQFPGGPHSPPDLRGLWDGPCTKYLDARNCMIYGYHWTVHVEALLTVYSLVLTWIIGNTSRKSFIGVVLIFGPVLMQYIEIHGDMSSTYRLLRRWWVKDLRYGVKKIRWGCWLDLLHSLFSTTYSIIWNKCGLNLNCDFLFIKIWIVTWIWI